MQLLKPMRIVFAFLLAVLSPCMGQTSALKPAENAVKGKLFISVDDSAVIFLNGNQLHKAPLNESESPEIDLKAGDRIVVQLKNTLGKGRFMMLFMSKDRTKMVAFRKIHFRILPDPEIKDFTATDFATYKKQAKAVDGSFAEPYLLPFKSNSDWVWGDVNVSSIGCLITGDMIKTNNYR